ncbi:MAG: hypothetical protein PV340_03000 [Wolbachia sp.]|nr:hypothetical protein [Wolbachia sp.]MDD9336425.1 hypothetical protein [Wolbachia sp.]
MKIKDRFENKYHNLTSYSCVEMVNLYYDTSTKPLALYCGVGGGFGKAENEEFFFPTLLTRGK